MGDEELYEVLTAVKGIGGSLVLPLSDLAACLLDRLPGHCNGIYQYVFNSCQSCHRACVLELHVSALPSLL